MMTHAETNDKPLHSKGVAALSRKFVGLWLVALVAISIFIRLYGAADYYYSADEAALANIAAGATPEEVWQFSHYEAPSPLSNMLRHYWMVFSQEPQFVRFFSLLFSVALIVLYYRIGLVLSGELCGLTCAALAAFSHGLIIQSYIVRNYCVFVFFLSAAFYYYLRWREGRARSMLAGYAFWGCLAALTHISTVFAVTSIAGFEALRMWCGKAPLRLHMQWVLANGIIVLAAVIIYWLWMPLLVPLHSYFAQYHISGRTLIPSVLLYPLLQSEYIFPSQASAFALLLCMAAFALKRGESAGENRAKSSLGLTFLALALGMLLVAINAYPYVGKHQGLWAVPFFITGTGAMIATLCESMTGRAQQAAAMGLLVAGCLLYSPQERFSDGVEYALPWKDWDGARAYMEALSPVDLIVTERDDGHLLANLFRYEGTDAFSGASMATLVPYRNTHILFNPYFPRSYSTAVFLANLLEARDKGMFAGADRVVFFRTAWSRSPVTDLMLCPALEKTLLTFPAIPGRALTREDIYGSYISIMTIPAQELLSGVLAEGGKARSCLDGRHDMTPGLMPPAAR